MHDARPLPRVESFPGLDSGALCSTETSTSLLRGCVSGRTRARPSAFAMASIQETAHTDQACVPFPVRRATSAVNMAQLSQVATCSATGAVAHAVLFPPADPAPIHAEDLASGHPTGDHAWGYPQQAGVMVYTAMWSEDDILAHAADPAMSEHVCALHLTQDALFTLPEFGYVQVMTRDTNAANALGFCDAECIDLSSGQRKVLHRTDVGQPWDLVGLSTSTSCCDALVPLTSCDLVRARSAASVCTVSASRAVSSASCITLHDLDESLPGSPPTTSTVGAMLCEEEESCGPAAFAAVQQCGKPGVVGHVLAPWRWAWAWAKAAAGQGVVSEGGKAGNGQGYGIVWPQLLSC